MLGDRQGVGLVIVPVQVADLQVGLEDRGFECHARRPLSMQAAERTRRNGFLGGLTKTNGARSARRVETMQQLRLGKRNATGFGDVLGRSTLAGETLGERERAVARAARFAGDADGGLATHLVFDVAETMVEASD